MTLFLGRLSGKYWMLSRLRCPKSEGRISIKDDTLDIYEKKKNKSIQILPDI